jgi:hypothetical protein
MGALARGGGDRRTHRERVLGSAGEPALGCPAAGEPGPGARLPRASGRRRRPRAQPDHGRGGGIPRAPLAHAPCAPGRSPHHVLAGRALARPGGLRHVPPLPVRGLARQHSRAEHGTRRRGPARRDGAPRSGRSAGLPRLPRPASGAISPGSRGDGPRGQSRVRHLAAAARGRVRDLPRPPPSALRASPPRGQPGSARAARRPAPQRCHLRLRLSARRVLRGLPPVRAERIEPQRQAAREHLRGMAREPRGTARPAMPGLPHARPEASVAGHPRSGDGQVGRAGEPGARSPPVSARPVAPP